MIDFGRFVALTVLGTGAPDSVRGIVREVNGDEPDRRVVRRGRWVREESLSGEVIHIVGPAGDWGRGNDDELYFVPRGPFGGEVTFGDAHRGGLAVGGERPCWGVWDGDDFTRPTGPVRDVEFLGRPAHLVELAPPPHKPHPMQVTIDAEPQLAVLRVRLAAST